MEDIESFVASVSESYDDLQFLNKKYKLINVLSSRQRIKDDDSEQSDVDVSDLPPAPKRCRVKRVTQSRNAVINEWLAMEETGDCYADLEDFIVP